MGRNKRRKYIRGAPHLLRQRGKKKIWYGLIDGREVSLETADAPAAQRRLLELADELRAAQRAPAAPPPALLSAVAAQYAEHLQPPRATAKTAATYTNRVLAFVEWCEANAVTRMAEVTFSLMATYVRERGTKVKARTVNRDVMPVARMFAFARREGLIPTNPFRTEDFRELKLREPEARPQTLTLSPTDVIRVVKASAELLTPGHSALIAVVAGSGLRISEALHLDAEDVVVLDDKRGFIVVASKANWQPKNYRCRRVPVTFATCQAALEFMRTRDSVRLDDKATWDALKKVSEHLGLPRFSMHDLRRAWASALHANGMSLKQVSVLLGHSGIAVTERYVRIFNTEHTGHEFLPL